MPSVCREDQSEHRHLSGGRRAAAAELSRRDGRGAAREKVPTFHHHRVFPLQRSRAGSCRSAPLGERPAISAEDRKNCQGTQEESLIDVSVANQNARFRTSLCFSMTRSGRNPLSPAPRGILTSAYGREPPLVHADMTSVANTGNVTKRRNLIPGRCLSRCRGHTCRSLIQNHFDGRGCEKGRKQQPFHKNDSMLHRGQATASDLRKPGRSRPAAAGLVPTV